ncbi:MAG: acyl-CoA thioesterase [Actinomycetales bacterium]|jgi:acyl-CoA thioester hydrolase|nr:acyl-CoA thioesterase [Actinomycetales bacterium]
MKYQHKAFVRWDDLDAMGHVNNAKYLTLAQEARFEWSFMQHHSKGEIPGLMEMVVAKAEVDFYKPINLGGIFVDVELWVEKIGNSSFVMVYEIRNGEELCARLKTVQVGVDSAASKSRPLTDSERKFLEQYLIPEA